MSDLPPQQEPEQPPTAEPGPAAAPSRHERQGLGSAPQRAARRRVRRLQTQRIRERRKQLRRDARAQSFSSRDPFVIGAIGLVLIAVMVVASFYVEDLPIIGGGTKYSAAFSEAAGLRSGDTVQVAGLKVGTVSGVSLHGNYVKVDFRVRHAFVGDQSSASIEVKTLLGAKYLAIDPAGNTKLKAGSMIPIDRTTAPYEVNSALTTLAQTAGQIDSKKLAQSFDTLNSAFQGTTNSIGPFLKGLSSVSQTIALNDSQLTALLKESASVSGILAKQSSNLQTFLQQSTQLLTVINQRRDAVNALLAGVTNLSAQLEGVVADNQATLKPALDQLDGVVSILQTNQDALNRSLQLLAPLFRNLTNATGSGPWIDGYLYNLTFQGIIYQLLGFGDYA